MSSSFADSFAFLVGINQLLILALSIPLEYVKLFFSFLERTCLLHFDTIQLFAICTTVTVILHSLIITSVQLKRIQGSSRMVAAENHKRMLPWPTNYLGTKSIISKMDSTRASFFERSIMMRHMMTTQIPLVLDCLVALVATYISTDCVHVQNMLKRRREL